MTKLQELKEVIIKANPEIFEWRCNGCNKKHSEYHNGCVYCWRDELSIEQNRKFFPKRKVMKIDRPIKLADVLITLRKKDITGLFNLMNGICYEHIGYSLGEELFSWNLEDDNLDNQNEETINFLHSICN